MSIEIEYDDVISTIGMLEMVEPHPDFYILFKSEEIIKECPIMIPPPNLPSLDGQGYS